MLKKYLSVLLVLSLLLISVPTGCVSANNVVAAAEDPKDKLKDAIVLYVGSPNAIINNGDAQIDKDAIEVSPYIKNGRTLVPVRFISEGLGAKVEWNSDLKKVTVNMGSIKLELILDSSKILVNGKEEELDAAAQISNGRTFVPLRKLAEAVGKKVFYDRGLIIISNSENIFDVQKEKDALDKIIAKVNVLPTLGSFENFKKLVSKANENNHANKSYSRLGGDMFKQKSMDSTNSMERSVMTAAPSSNEALSGVVADKVSSDYSKTNVQVEGVDEGDIIKTDGKYIYQVNNEQVIIVKSNPANEMKVVSKINFANNKEFVIAPLEMYVDTNSLTVISSKSSKYNQYQPQIEDDTGIMNKAMPSIMPYRNNKQFTNITIFDTSDISNPKIKREVDLEGNYISSRKINSNLYVVSNKFINAYSILNEKELPKNSDILPTYKDSVVSKDYIEKQFSDIACFPESMEQNYMNIAGLDISNNVPANVYSIMGAGNNIYASSENLYVALSKYNYPNIQPMVRGGIVPTGKMAANSSIRYEAPKEATRLFKFSLNKGNVTFLNKGEVNGKILNQYSMDESGNYFRIATTSGNKWESSGENMSKNNVFILDETMQETGKIENIAPGEKIYSVRFMGAKAYMVTFKKVDPLFVLDLSNPKEPKILGKLKIPGFSDYLHPYDENHIIGFGKDTVENKDSAFIMGFKMAMFDVTDVNNPKQQFVELIGDRGTTSQLLNNPKALLFSKEKNLLAFPITVMTVANKVGNSNQGWGPEYGTFEYQGAYVYTIDPAKGFVLKGKITHLSNDEMLKAGMYNFDYEKEVQRILYTDDNLYTASNKILKANKISDLSEIKSIDLK